MSDDTPWTTSTRVVLETGSWWEVDRDDVDHFMAHARAYVASDKVNPEARERVRKVWLLHQHAPPWRKREGPPTPIDLKGVVPFHRKPLRTKTNEEIGDAVRDGSWRTEVDEETGW